MASSVNDPGLLMMQYSALGEAHSRLGQMHADLVKGLTDLTNHAHTVSQGNKGMWIGRAGQSFERAFEQDFAALRAVLAQLEAAHTVLPRLLSTVQEADAQASALFRSE